MRRYQTTDTSVSSRSNSLFPGCGFIPSGKHSAMLQSPHKNHDDVGCVATRPPTPSPFPPAAIVCFPAADLSPWEAFSHVAIDTQRPQRLRMHRYQTTETFSVSSRSNCLFPGCGFIPSGKNSAMLQLIHKNHDDVACVTTRPPTPSPFPPAAIVCSPAAGLSSRCRRRPGSRTAPQSPCGSSVGAPSVGSGGCRR